MYLRFQYKFKRVVGGFSQPATPRSAIADARTLPEQLKAGHEPGRSCAKEVRDSLAAAQAQAVEDARTRYGAEVAKRRA